MVCDFDLPALLSIVIPTRNRTPYAISAIESILEIPDRRLELVVQDNSDSCDLRAHVEANVKDPRCRYRYTPPPLSLIDNFNAALEMATGEYVCLIGDDDGVNPEIMQAAAWAKANEIDCVAMRPTASYVWQGSGIPSTLFTKAPGGTLSVSASRGGVKEVDLERELRKFVRDGGTRYLKFSLPRLYHGLVHRRCLSAVREKTGAYLGGLTPDAFASVAVACVARRLVVTDYPLTLPGACSVSGTVVEGVLKRHSKKLDDAPHLRHRGVYHWCELVPRVYTPYAIWADSAVAALRAMGRDDLVGQLNLPKLAAQVGGADRSNALPVLQALFMGLRIMRKNRAMGAACLASALITCHGGAFVCRAWNRFLVMTGMRASERIDGLTNMVEASHALSRHLQGRERSFARYIS